jgi:uncharacterized membrane protein
MNQLLLILHLFGFGGAMGASIGNFLVAQQAAAAPADAPALTKVRFALARTSQVGLGLLWLTGLILVWSKYGGPGGMPAAFWIKIALVVLVTVVVAVTSLAIKQVRNGDTAAGARLPVYGIAGAVLFVFIVVFAVIAFSP